MLFSCPGQGSQYAGMLDHLPDSPISKKLLEQANEVLNESCLDLDSAIALQSSRSVQLCLLISAVCHAQYLIAQQVLPDFCCGLSIGAFPAAVICGALDYQDAVKLVALRGELMQQTYPQGFGLSVIIGLSRWQVESLITEIHQSDNPVYLANINSDDQMVIAGNEQAMEEVMQLAKQQGARKTQRLAVSVPSHCELLDQPAKQLFAAMQNITIKCGDIAYLSGSTGRVLWRAEQIRDDLAFNMARQIHWHEAMLAAYQRDVRLAIEMPPGNSLTRLTKAVMPQGEAIAVSQSNLQLITTLTRRNKEKT